MSKVKISIIIPYYKKKKFIEQTLGSVLNQTFTDYEILIVYDDELKNDLKFIKSLSKSDKRIKLLINRKNIGAGASRNKAISMSKGELIAFIDSDDIWYKDKLKTQLNYFKKNNLDFCHTAYDIVDKNDNKLSFRKSKKILYFEDLLKSCDIGLSTVLMKKKLIKNNICFGRTKTKEDYILWLKLAKKGIQINFMNKKLSSWRKVEKSLSSSVSQKLFDGFLVYYRYMEYNFLKSFFYLIRLSVNSLLR